MSWKLFENPYRRKVSIYCVRFTINEKIFLSRSIIQKLQLRSDHVAQVWYDDSNKQVGIAFGLAFDANPLPIRGLGQQNAYINVRGFFKFFDLQHPSKDIKLQADFNCKTLIFTLP
jgi:hypothetical protein